MKKPPRLLLTCVALSPCAAIAQSQPSEHTPRAGEAVPAAAPLGVRAEPVWRIRERLNSPSASALLGGSLVTSVETFSGFPLTNFANPPGSLVSLSNQIGVDGFPMGAISIVGAATDAAMMSVQPGAPGGIAPVGVLRSTGLPPGAYGVIARRSGQDPRKTFLSGSFEYMAAARAVGIGAPYVLSTDRHLLDASSMQRLFVYDENIGIHSLNILFGGTFPSGSFSSLKQFTDPITNQLDRFIVVGPRPSAVAIGDFFAPPRSELAPFPVGQWFTLMYVSTIGPDGIPGKSVWLKSNETVAAGFLDPRLASGLIVPNDGDPLGWLNIMPGIDDDPATLQPEGIGLATNEFGQPAPTLGHLGQYIDTSSESPNVFQFDIGSDPAQSIMPEFAANDMFFDDIAVTGRLFTPPAFAPDNIIPFSNTFEDAKPNTPANVNQPHWPTPLPPSQALISEQSSDTLHVNMVSRTLWRDTLQRIGIANFPRVTPFPRPLPGQPTVVNMRARLTSTPGATSREILLRQSGTSKSLILTEGLLPDTSALSIILGPADPSDGVRAAGLQIWVRQANPDFDPSADAQDRLVERHWLPASLWTNPPADAPFNTRMTLVPTGVAFPTDSFFDISIEFEPDPTDPADFSAVRITVDGTPLHPFGDPTRSFRAPVRTTTSVEFYSGANPGGDGDFMSVDDIMFTGPQTFVPGDAAFSLPFNEQFDGYTFDATIDRQGSTIFNSRKDHSDLFAAYTTAPTRTILTDPLAQPAPGELVCRYRVESALFGSGLLVPTQIVAVPFADISPAPPGTFNPQNCVGSTSNDTDFLVRAGTNQPRLETGEWRLLNQSPFAFNPALGDATGFRFESFDAGQFDTLGSTSVPVSPESIRVRRLGDALPGAEGAGGAALEMIANFSIRPNSLPLPNSLPTDSVRALLPVASADADTVARLTYDLYIESLNGLGAPDDTLAPRSRLSTAVLSQGIKITSINFGGPNTNAGSSSFPPPPALPADRISVEVINPATGLSTIFEDTGVSVLTGGAGLDGVIAGPLVNRWITVIVEVDGDGNWTAAIDEDRDGPSAPVTIAAGAPINATALPAIEQLVISEGRDPGADGRPMPRAARIRTLPGGGAAIAPANADAVEDYCFYRVSNVDSIDSTIAPMVFDPRTGTSGASISQSIIAVLNRRTDGQGSVVGPRIHEHCPWSIGTTDNKIELQDAATGDTAFRGSWVLAGGVGFNRFIEPIPAGGIQVTDGPAQLPPVAYTNITTVAIDAPGVAVAAQNPILLAEWATDPNDGWDPPVTFPRARWLFDNITLGEVALSTCADLNGDGSVNGLDLLIILNDFGAGPNGSGSPLGNPAADINGDGVVNGVDLLLLLNDFGDCA